jgi:hypothetical protein
MTDLTECICSRSLEHTIPSDIHKPWLPRKLPLTVQAIQTILKKPTRDNPPHLAKLFVNIFWGQTEHTN